jgi:hypothetical protein
VRWSLGLVNQRWSGMNRSHYFKDERSVPRTRRRRSAA